MNVVIGWLAVAGLVAVLLILVIGVFTRVIGGSHPRFARIEAARRVTTSVVLSALLALFVIAWVLQLGDTPQPPSAEFGQAHGDQFFQGGGKFWYEVRHDGALWTCTMDATPAFSGGNGIWECWRP